MNVLRTLRVSNFVLVQILMASAGIIIFFLLIYTIMMRPEMVGVTCISSLLLVLLTGVVAFMKNGLIIRPKNAKPSEIEEIAIYNRFEIFILVVAAYFLYGRIGIAILYPVLTSTYAGAVFYMAIALYTVVFISIMVLAMLRIAIPLDIRFEGGDMLVYYRGEEKRFKIRGSEVSLLSSEQIAQFFPDRKTKNNSVIYITSENKEEMLISMPDNKDFKEFWKYLFYRLNPQRYSENESVSENYNAIHIR